VAVEPGGLDPCDLRLQKGDAAVRDLIESRVPLFEFAIKSALASYDLNTSEGRIAALDEATPIIRKIRDSALRPEYSRRLAGWLGMDPTTVAKAIGGSAPASNQSRKSTIGSSVERESLKAALQLPGAVSEWYASVDESTFVHPKAAAVHVAIAKAGGPTNESEGMAWIDEVLANAENDEVRSTIRELTVEPMPTEPGTQDRYAVGMIARLLELDSSKKIDELKGQLTRSEESGEPTQLLNQLVELETYRRSLREISFGEA
jgi:DNA primase